MRTSPSRRDAATLPMAAHLVGGTEPEVARDLAVIGAREDLVRRIDRIGEPFRNAQQLRILKRDCVQLIFVDRALITRLETCREGQRWGLAQPKEGKRPGKLRIFRIPGVDRRALRRVLAERPRRCFDHTIEIRIVLSLIPQSPRPPNIQPPCVFNDCPDRRVEYAF